MSGFPLGSLKGVWGQDPTHNLRWSRSRGSAQEDFHQSPYSTRNSMSQGTKKGQQHGWKGHSVSQRQELGQALTQGREETPGETLRTKPAGLPAPKGTKPASPKSPPAISGLPSKAQPRAVQALEFHPSPGCCWGEESGTQGEERPWGEDSPPCRDSTQVEQI